MEELRGRVAFITGGASGIGLGIARALIAEGMRVAVADLRRDALRGAVQTLAAEGSQALAVELDVRDRAAWIRASEQVSRELGPVQVLCSNAGVNFVGPTHRATAEDWEFCLSVNLGGAINAVQTFVPRMIEHAAGAHIVITSSVSGLFTSGGAGCYVTSKFALVGLAESLRADLAGEGIGVSVLCPGPVQSELFESTIAVRPASLAATGSIPVIAPGVRREDTPIFATAPNGLEIGRRVVLGIRRNDLYILTHPEIRPVLEARAAALAALLPDEPVAPSRVQASEQLLSTALYASEIAKRPPKAAPRGS
ncbi:MAG TPA: SDR family NAD(P)-dependent oxidoreductase [Steroidobacteraceae bacterium]|nr:SDR family NAD(P)-dependent oxidoreductase [Steroidobacteraceae bacterium]